MALKRRSTTRRNVLTMLGLAGASSAALATDDIIRDDKRSGAYKVAHADYAKMATALERLAAEMRAGSINVTKFEIVSDAMKMDTWLGQELRFGFEIKDEG